MKALYLCGATNPEGVRLALAVNRKEKRWDAVRILDDDPTQKGRKVLGVEVAGPFEELARAAPGSAEVVNLVARTTRKRAAARARIEPHGFPFARLTDPGVDLEGASVAAGTTIYEQAIVCPLSTVGEGTVVFMRAVVGHGSRAGAGCVIAPGAVLNARVELGEGVYVGSNATLLPEVRVGAWATIGAGSVVLQDVPAGATVFGVPAQVISMAPAEAVAGGDHNAKAPAPIDLERAVAGIWCEILGLASVDAGINFFDLGGDSLRALRVCARIQESVHREMPITDLFQYPTVRSLARHLSAAAAGAEAASPGLDRAVIRRRILQGHRHG